MSKTKFFQAFLSRYESNAIIQNAIAKNMILELWFYLADKKLEKVLEIGCGSGVLTKKLIKKFTIEHLFINDIIEDGNLKQHLEKKDMNFTFIKELNQAPKKLDVIVSTSSVHWINDVKFFSLHASQHLKKNGILALNIFLKTNYCETSEGIDNKKIFYASKKKALSELQKKFKILRIREETNVLAFDNPVAVFRHFRNIGVNSLSLKPEINVHKLIKNLPSKSHLFQTLTYDSITVLCEKK